MKKRVLAVLSAAVIATTSLAFVGCGAKGEDYKNKEINVIMTSATIPPMLSMLDTVGNGNPTFAWIGRQNTIYSVEEFANMYPSCKLITEWSTASNIPASVVNKMSEYVSDAWYKSKRSCKFNIYVTDYGVLSAFKLVAPLNVPESNYKIHLMEDGSGAYSQFMTSQDLDAAGAIENFNTTKQLLLEQIDRMKSGTFTDPESFTNYNYVYPATTISNVDYYLQYPEMLTSADTEIQALIDSKEMTFTKKHETEMYKALSPEKQEQIKKVIIDPSVAQQMTATEGKKVLMITGTAFNAEMEFGDINNAGAGNHFENTIDYIINTYGSQYKIVYKGHPSWGLLENEFEISRWNDVDYAPNGFTKEQLRAAGIRRKTFLEEKGISILPAQTPAEALTWAFSDNLMLCGYDSSLYMNVSGEQVLGFIRGSDIAANVDPYSTLSGLNPILFGQGGIFHNENIKFFTPSSIVA